MVSVVPRLPLEEMLERNSKAELVEKVLREEITLLLDEVQQDVVLRKLELERFAADNCSMSLTREEKLR